MFDSEKLFTKKKKKQHMFNKRNNSFIYREINSLQGDQPTHANITDDRIIILKSDIAIYIFLN